MTQPKQPVEGSPVPDSVQTSLRPPRTYYLPRLHASHYQGDAVVHWTLTIADRRQGWLSPAFHAAFREMVLHASARQGLLTPAYCLMPDHIHLVWMGLSSDSDQRLGMRFLREHLRGALGKFRFQHQAHDHVLRRAERERNAFEKVVGYVLHNPVRGGLVERAEQWDHSGAVIPGYPRGNPLSAEFWPVFWQVYRDSLEPGAGRIKRPVPGRFEGL